LMGPERCAEMGAEEQKRECRGRKHSVSRQRRSVFSQAERRGLRQGAAIAVAASWPSHGKRHSPRNGPQASQAVLVDALSGSTSVGCPLRAVTSRRRWRKGQRYLPAHPHWARADVPSSHNRDPLLKPDLMTVQGSVCLGIWVTVGRRLPVSRYKGGGVPGLQSCCWCRISARFEVEEAPTHKTECATGNVLSRSAGPACKFDVEQRLRLQLPRSTRPRGRIHPSPLNIRDSPMLG
jgi:hypothetical protein